MWLKISIRDIDSETDNGKVKLEIPGAMQGNYARRLEILNKSMSICSDYQIIKELPRTIISRVVFIK